MEAFYTKPPITSIVEEEPQHIITDKPQELEPITTTQNAPYFRRKTTKSPEVKKPSNPQIKRKPSRGAEFPKICGLFNNSYIK